MNHAVRALCVLSATATIACAQSRAGPTEAEPSLRRPTLEFARGEAKPFGTPHKDGGQDWLTIGGGIANDFEDATDINLRVAWSRFLNPGIEFSLEANLWSFNQPGKDAIGINPAFLFRWHFYRTERLTLFGDIGIGLLFSTDNVPAGGTSFNFTPRAGVGLTYQLTDTSSTRLQLGLRWHHVSNAAINGDTKNPARDAAMVYAGLVFPF